MMYFLKFIDCVEKKFINVYFIEKLCNQRLKLRKTLRVASKIFLTRQLNPFSDFLKGRTCKKLSALIFITQNVGKKLVIQDIYTKIVLELESNSEHKYHCQFDYAAFSLISTNI